MTYLTCDFCGGPANPNFHPLKRELDILVGSVTCWECELLPERDRVAKKVIRFLRDLPPGQGWEVIRHDPPTEVGYYFTVQLVGPPLMERGRFVGAWDGK